MALTEKPQFVDVDPLVIAQEMKTYYETQLGKSIQPADIEQLLINGFAYRESILRNQINSTAVQNLVTFSSAPVLDYLGYFVGVTRIPAAAAACQISLSFTGNTIPTVIPEGTRIASQDGKVFFRTVEAVTIAANQSSATVEAICETEGIDGNGYNPGEISVIQDPQPYLVSAVNTDITTGGALAESDDQLRERIQLAPAQFSNAGSVEGYKFWALTANPSIIDVGVPRVPAVPGTVMVWPLIASGDVTPSEILTAVFDILNADKIRPTTDTVVVQSPTRINYSLDIRLTLFTDAPQDETVQIVTQNANDFVLEKRQKLGRDIIGAQLIAALMEGVKDNVYDIDLHSFTDVIVPQDNSFAFCTGITITVTGTNNG